MNTVNGKLEQLEATPNADFSCDGSVLRCWHQLHLVFSVNATAQDYVPYFDDSADSAASSEVNPGLYPPLSSGEASPWQDELPEADLAPVLPQENPWASQPNTSANQAYAAPGYPTQGYPTQGYSAQGYPAQSYAVPQAAVPGVTTQPGYGYPAQPYGYANPYGMGAPMYYSPGVLPQMPYGYGMPYGALPGYGPNYNSNGFNPFNFLHALAILKSENFAMRNPKKLRFSGFLLSFKC